MNAACPPWGPRVPAAFVAAPALDLGRQDSQQVAWGALQVRGVRTFAVELSCDGDVLHDESVCSGEGRLPTPTNFFSSCYADRSHLCTSSTCVPRLTGERGSSKRHRLTASEDRRKSRSATGLPESCALAPAHRHRRTLTFGYIKESRALVCSICQPSGRDTTS